MPLETVKDGTYVRTCSLCEAMCGIEVTVGDGRVAKVRANEADVFSRGYICPKGTALGELHHDPDRLRQPLIRDGSGFREATWDEALERAWELLRDVVDAHGIEAVTAYIGNPTVHNVSLSRYVPIFLPMAGLPTLYSAGTIDQWPKNLVAALCFGGMWTFPIPDLDRTEYLLILGANPHASQGSLISAPGFLRRMSEIRARGGKVVVVDPRRTGTAARADEWLGITPGTDALLLAAIARTIFADGLVRLGALEGRVQGLAEVETLVADFTPESVAHACGVSAETIRRIARELAASPRAAVYGRIGTCTQAFGTLASWLVEVLNVITGNLDREGGAMFGKPVAWSMMTVRPPEFAEGFAVGRWQSRVRGASEVLGQVPLSCLAEEIDTEGEGQIRALITVAGNPVISAPNATRLDAALAKIPCMIAVDNFLNETTRHAHVILPGLSPFEQAHCDDVIWSWAVRSAFKHAPALFPPEPDATGARPEEWEILLLLAGILQGQRPSETDVHALDDTVFEGLLGVLAAQERSPIAGLDPADILARTPGKGPERLIDFSLRIGPWGERYGERPEGLTLAAMASSPNGVDMGPLVPRLDEVLETASGMIELAPLAITKDLERLRARRTEAPEGLVLVSRRHLRSNNSWMHNAPSLMTGRDRCTLLIHPEDAARVGVSDGAQARVTSSAGELLVRVEVSDEMRIGVVSLPHGFGHDKPGTRLTVASQRAGVCNNVLAPAELVDVPSGNAVVNGIPVVVSPASVRRT